MNPDELKKALNEAVPEPPEVDGWADAVRARSGRHQSAGRLALAVVVVVALAALPFAWRALAPRGIPAVPAASHPAPEAPASGTSPGGPALPGDPCAALGKVPTPETFVELPEGASGVFACDVDRETRLASRGGAPADVVAPDEFAAMIRGASRTLPQACTADLGALYALVFTWSGRQVVVPAEAGGCGPAGGRYGIGRQLKTAFEAAVVRERAASGTKPSGTPAPPGCWASSWIEADRTTTVVASACYEHRAAAPIEGWAEIAAATASGATPAEPPADFGDRTIMAADGRGEVVELRLGEREIYWNDPEPGPDGRAATWAYRPTDAQWARIASALATAREQGAAPALCPDGVDAPAARTLTGVTAASRCVAGADGAVVEYVLTEKYLEVMAAEAQPGALPQPTCTPEAAAAAARDRIVVRDASGGLAALTRTCVGSYQGAGVYWLPSAEWRGHLDALAPR